MLFAYVSIWETRSQGTGFSLHPNGIPLHTFYSHTSGSAAVAALERVILVQLDGLAFIWDPVEQVQCACMCKVSIGPPEFLTKYEKCEMFPIHRNDQYFASDFCKVILLQRLTF